MPKLEVAIEPVQDLHGYDAPWVGGAGKNKCPINSGSITVGDFVTFSTPLPSGTYSISFKATRTPSSGSYASLVLYDKDGVAYSPVIGIPSNKLDGSIVKSEAMVINNGLSKIYVYSIAGQWSESRNYTLTISDLQIEQGSTATTFAPYSNICPIIGWDEVNVGVSGVNVWDEEWEVGNINDGSGEDLPQDNVIRSKGYISVMSGENYYIKCPTTGISRLFLYAEDKSFITYVPIDNITDNIYTIPNNCAFIRFRTLAAYGTTYNNDISINYPSSDTSYHAYNGQTYTIDLDGTRYGGKVDLVSGVMTVDRMQKSISGGFSMASNNVLYIDDMLADGLVNNAVISSHYPFGALLTSTSGALQYERQFCLQDVAGHGMRYMVYDSNFESASDFNTLLSTTPSLIVILLYTNNNPAIEAATPTVRKDQRRITVPFFFDEESSFTGIWMSFIRSITLSSNPSGSSCIGRRALRRCIA